MARPNSCTVVCPLPECRQINYSKDGKHYGVHYQKVTDKKPCQLSCKPIQEKK